MTKPLLIGLAGALGAGKTSFAQRLIERWGFVAVNHGDAIKDEIATTLRRTLKAHYRAARPDIRDRDDLGAVSEEQWSDYIRTTLWERRDEFTRALLQEWGTELRRREDPDYWIHQWEARIQPHLRVVADNVRFPNEAESIRARGGVLVRITRHTWEPFAGAHVSETALAEWAEWDFTIKNDGTREDLAAEADRVARAAGAV